MIQQININENINSYAFSNARQKNIQQQNFKGGVWNMLLLGLQECEKHPMINVTVIDMLSAILPRTIIESLTNKFAGFEAFRREFSGLAVNCLLPSWITLCTAFAVNKMIMPKNVNMSKCWADTNLIEKITDFYKNSGSDDKIKDSFKGILENIEGYDGKSKVRFNDAKILSQSELENYSAKLKELSLSNKTNKEIKKEIEKITDEIVKKTHVHDNINIGNKNSVKVSNLTDLLNDTVKFFKEFSKADKHIDITDFAKRSKKLVTAKSLTGLTIVLPLAASMQYINRRITEKASGTKGAPIYNDFGKNDKSSEHIKAQENKSELVKQKILSISSMIAVCMLSMLKLPSLKMLEFKGIFPTMDQARLISTTTFASRMAVADDANELKEATIRDIATFLGLYFLGDYVAKGTATIIQKKKGVVLLNDTKPIEKNASIWKKIHHWFKDVNIKSSKEVTGKTAEELKKAVNYRSTCQAASISVSLLLLGLIIPIFTRRRTEKKHAETTKVAQDVPMTDYRDKNIGDASRRLVNQNDK